MPDLGDLSVFERVAALKSFFGAARSLSRPKSTVSRSIARLKEALGARLMQRTTRDVALTPAGEALAARTVRVPCGRTVRDEDRRAAHPRKRTYAARINANASVGSSRPS